jgi:valyl-tRNA synthetase
VTRALEAYEFDAAASAIYSFIWNDFCDWLVEVSKPALRAGDASVHAELIATLRTAMRLLHPFMPFLSEEIWQKLPADGQAPESLCVEQWPSFEGNPYKNDERDFELLQEMVRATRNLRSEGEIGPSKKIKLSLLSLSANAEKMLRENSAHVIHLANLGELEVLSANAARPENALSAALPEVEIFLPLEGLIDKDKERGRLIKEIETRAADLAFVEKKLSNPQFVERAKPEVVAKEQAKREELALAIAKLKERLSSL